MISWRHIIWEYRPPPPTPRGLSLLVPVLFVPLLSISSCRCFRNKDLSQTTDDTCIWLLPRFVQCRGGGLKF